MNPVILKSIAKGAELAYSNREVALDILSKIQVWRKSKDQQTDAAVSVTVEERLERLESGSETRDILDEEQSELLAGLAASVAELSSSSQALLARTKMLIGLIVLSMCLSIAALVLALMG
ncbi:hypothetical protein NT6N_26080 [Oceaniferula spumae]|uniref:DUF1640 domain-containing protein n=1 Tax=Oceaniferula spumae TaxID=2979115 RepID=A0AAT9FNL6_9BACT